MAGDGKIGFWSITAIGVGGMVGGGIFAVLGLAVQLARGGTPIAFLLAGVVALLTAYSYARLSVRFPSQGGTVVFLDRAFGVDLVTGSINSLLWLSYIVMLALYAFAFGSYGAALTPWGESGLARHVLISAGILAPALLNVLSADLVGRAETAIVGVKIAILLLFVGVGVRGIDRARLAPDAWAPALPLVAGGMIIFLAYEGFELIANAAADSRDPERTIPRSFYAAVLFVIALYVAVSAVTVGSLAPQTIVEAKDYALAEAARPFLGQTGFTLIAVAALLSTFSAINATMYGSARLSYTIAKEGELPSFLERKVWSRPIEGLLITTGAALLLANLGDLSSISTMGSAGFLIIFGAVNAANVALAGTTSSRRWISIAGVVACALALTALLVRTALDAPARLGVLGGLIGLAVGVELVYRFFVREGLDVSGEPAKPK